MNGLVGAVSMAFVVLGFAGVWLARQTPHTRADGIVAVIGFASLLVGAAGIGWVIA